MRVLAGLREVGVLSLRHEIRDKEAISHPENMVNWYGNSFYELIPI